MDEAQASPTRVVVIDDSQDIRDVVRLALGRADDFEFTAEADGGESGLAVVEATQPDLVLLDIAMPDMDGLQVLPLIRSAAPGAIVVMLTAFDEEVAAISAVEQGTHGFIRKGVGVTELLDRMREILEVRLGARDRTRGV